MPMPHGSSRSANLVALGVLLVSGRLLASESIVPVALSARVETDVLVLSVIADERVGLTHRVDGPELLITFDAPVRVDVPSGLLESTSGWIGGVQTGFDTLLVRVARDAEFIVSQRAGSLEARVVARAASDPEDDARGRRRLALLRAQLYAARGDGDAEVATLYGLARQAPDDVHVLAALGATERRIGWRRKAQATLERAQAADRADPEVRRQLAEMRAERAPRGRIDVEHRTVAGEWSTSSQRFESSGALSDAVLFGGRLEMVHFDARRVRRAGGGIGPMRRTRPRGEIWFDADTRQGSTWSASLAGASSGPGGTFGFSRPQPSGKWTLQAELQRPFWEFAEGLAGEGTRDRVVVERRQRLGGRADSWITLSVNRYSVADGAHARTAGLSGGLVLQVQSEGPYVAVSYGLDKESLRGATWRRDESGTAFAPVPIIGREIHVPGVLIRHGIDANLSLDTYAGYAVDRLGGHGPVLEARARWSRPRAVAELWVDRRLQTLATTTVATRVGASVALRF